MEEVFDYLVQDFIRRAEKVDCAPDEYIDGLKHAVEEIRVAIQAAEETRNG